MSTAELIRRLLNRRARLENRSAAELLRLLQESRRDILAELLSPHGRFDDFRFRVMISVIDRKIAEASALSGRVVDTAVRGSWDAGLEFGAVGVPKAFIYDVSPDVLRAISSVTKDSINDVWIEAGKTIKVAVRRVTLGVDNLSDAIRRLSGVLRSPKVFGTVETRAEMIIRTEVNRTFSMAADAQMGQAGKAMAAGGFELRKYWLSAHDSRVRETHAEAAKTYSKANAIPETEAYIVDGEALMYPLDPTASASNSIGCRCVSVPVVREP